MEFLSNNFITDFFVGALKGISGLVLEYSIAIVILTILIRLVLLPLDMKQRVNSKKMAAIGPELQSLQKRYANDPQRLQQKQQELYRKMKVNPLMGCLPALIQLPILFAFFGAMRVLSSEQTISLVLDATHYGTQAVSLPSFLWVHNFWQPDSGFVGVLPTATEFLSFIQQNAITISPQTLSILQQQGMISFGTSTLLVNDAVYTGMANEIISNNGLTGYANGWFILPIISGASLFIQQKFGASDMGTGGMQGQPGGKFMLWFFPLFSVWICATSNSAFALYWSVSSIYAFGQMRLVGAIQKKRAQSKEIVIQ